MHTGLSRDSEIIAARFIEARQRGERLSVDQVIEAHSPPGERSGIRAEVLSLIEQRRNAVTHGAGSSGQVAPLPGVPAEPLPAIDGYVLIDNIGRGGMGVVYEAYQLSTGRRVAIKVMRDGADAAPAYRERFEREVELVARLNHPGIVSIVDSGLHSGRYFYAMTFVDGRRLDEAHVPGRAALPEVLRTMIAICEAVDHAHQHGVLHRDLKPSNVLLDGESRPHVVDFGLAKAVDAATGRRMDVSLSEPGQLIGTLGYMSPEQARGQLDRISVRSDVYSMGAICYELVTGVLPCDTDGPLEDMLRRIDRQDPSPPSKLRRGVDADLDAVLLKALEKDPARRYPTAAQLADDLRRCLDHRSVVARRAGAGDRAIRWARRNRALTGVGLAALIILVVTTSVSFHRILAARDQARLAESEEGKARARAEAAALDAKSQARRADRINRFLLSMLAAANPMTSGRPGMTVRESLDEAARLIDDMLKDDPADRAAVHLSLGMSYRGIGAYDRARSHLETALALHDRLHSGPNLELARNLSELGVVLIHAAEFDAAEGSLRRSREMFAALGPDVTEDALANLSNIASVYHERHQYADAERLYREALEAVERAPGADPSRTPRAMMNLAGAVSDLDRNEEAERLCEAALERLVGDQPIDRAARAAALYSYAIMLRKTGHYVAAEDKAREALVIREQTLGPDHPETARCRRLHGNLLTSLDRFDEGMAQIQQALDHLRRAYPPRHPEIALTLAEQGTTLLQRGDFTAAELTLREALSIREQILPADHPDLMDAHYLVGLVQSRLRSFEESARSMQTALDMRRRYFGRDDGMTIRYLDGLALAVAKGGDPARAQTIEEQAIALARRLLRPDHPDFCSLLPNLAQIKMQLGEFQAADALLAESEEILQRQESGDSTTLGFLTNNRAMCLLQMGKLADAEERFRRVLDLRIRIYGRVNPFVLTCAENLAETLLRRKKFADAGGVLDDGLDILDRLPEARPESAAWLTRRRGDAHMGLREWAKAESRYRESVAKLRDLVPPGHPERILAQQGLARSLMEQDQAATAEPMLRECLTDLESAPPDAAILRAAIQCDMGRCLTAMKQYEEAESVLSAARTILVEAGGTKHEMYRTCLNRLAALNDAWGRPEEAASVRRELAQAGEGAADSTP